MGLLLNGMKKCGYDLQLISEEEFMTRFNAMMHDEKKSSYLSGMLHYGKMIGTEVLASNEFTTVILYKLGFIWPLPDKNYVEEFIEKIDGLGFFEEV